MKVDIEFISAIHFSRMVIILTHTLPNGCALSKVYSYESYDTMLFSRNISINLTEIYFKQILHGAYLSWIRVEELNELKIWVFYGGPSILDDHMDRVKGRFEKRTKPVFHVTCGHHCFVQL